MGNVLLMMENIPTQRITSALKFLAVDAKLSQGSLAEKAGMSQSAVNRRFSGETSLSVEDLEHLAEALGYRVKVTFEEVAA